MKARMIEQCLWCGVSHRCDKMHTRDSCPANEKVRFNCGIEGHFGRMCHKEKINASATETQVEDTKTGVSKKTQNDEKGDKGLAETMDPRGAIQPQTLVGPDGEAEQLTMSFRNLVPEL